MKRPEAAAQQPEPDITPEESKLIDKMEYLFEEIVTTYYLNEAGQQKLLELIKCAIDAGASVGHRGTKLGVQSEMKDMFTAIGEALRYSGGNDNDDKLR